MTRDTDDTSDAEALADAMLNAVEADVEADADEAMPDVLVTAMHAARRLGIDFVRRYNRLDIDTEASVFDTPVLFVANHGFGGIFDLNVFATGAALDQLDLDRPLTILTHQLAWTLGIGRFIEVLGARPAAPSSLEEAVRDGHHVLVFPGGDIEAGKSWRDRDRIIFGGRSGFARLAIEHAVPIVPIVTAGAGESLFVLSSGQRLARAIRLDKLLRLKTAPISVSLPWGVSVGAVGLLPYLPLPTKLHTRVLPAMTAVSGETAEDYAARVQTTMQQALSDLTRTRRPLLG